MVITCYSVAAFIPSISIFSFSGTVTKMANLSREVSLAFRQAPRWSIKGLRISWVAMGKNGPGYIPICQ